MRLSLFRERGRGREKRDRNNVLERNIDWLPPIHAPSEDPTHKPGICPERELSLPPVGAQDGAPTK